MVRLSSESLCPKPINASKDNSQVLKDLIHPEETLYGNRRIIGLKFIFVNEECQKVNIKF